MTTQTLTLESELVADLTSHLELGVRGAIPNPEFAAQLLRRFKTAIAQSARGFTAPEPDNTLYQNAPPPRA
jgi:hypothetical protein